MPDPFISREDLGDYLGQSLTTSDKALQCVDAACDAVRDVTGQTFNAVANETIILDGTGTDALLLPQLPVTSVSSVIEDDDTLVVSTDYKLNGRGMLLRLPSVEESGWSTNYLRRTWRLARQNISVTYSHGYASADLPRSIRMVALSLAARLFTQGAGIVFESLGQRSVRYEASASDFTKGELLILHKYRR